MKSKILTFLIFFCGICLNGQILNGSFEDWEFNGYYNQPLSWNTSLDTNVIRYSKDSSSVHGEYSLKINSNVFDHYLGCTTRFISTIFLTSPFVQQHSLYFHLKIRALNSPGPTIFKIAIKLYKNNTFKTSLNWSTDQEIKEFSEIEIPIEYSDFNTMKIHISGGGQNSILDGCYARSDSWIDGLELRPSSIVNINNLYRQTTIIYPNPVSEYLNLSNNNSRDAKYKIFDNLGKCIRLGNIRSNEIDVGELPNGLYVLMVQGIGKWRFVKIDK